MNKLLLDDAEIANVIAQYINVQDLVAVTITASTIKSSDNGASFSLLPDGTMSCTKATIKGAITATSGSFTGTVNANAGTFNNVTISENCNVLGTVYAGRIVGDVYRKKEFTLPAKGQTGPFNPWVEVPILSATISASPFQQRIILENIASSFRSAGTGTNATGYLRARLNGVVYDIASKNMGSDTSIFRLAGPFSATVPANAIGTLDVFITASQTFYFSRNEVLFGALECFKAESAVLAVNVA